MSRRAAVEDTEVFRVLETRRRGEASRTFVHGPFRTLSAARALVTRGRREESRRASWHGAGVDPETTFVIERAATVWEEVPTK